MLNTYNLTFALYGVAFIVSAVTLAGSKKAQRIFSYVFLAAGFVVNTTYIVQRWMEAGRAPFSNTFESLVLFSWTIALVQIAMYKKIKLPLLDTAAMLMVVLALAYSTFFDSEIQPLVPALKSNWLTFHVSTCFLGYGGFALSFVAAILYVVGSREKKRFSDEILASLDEVNSKTVAFGFQFLTIGILTGAVWANSAWGTYWSWDPKEVWSLITWIIYACFLHGRYMQGWGPRVRAWIAIIGFAAVLFTYFGVNFLLSGLHSYA
ncbi:c-type cytochrome biogenesis protein CcsB [bacterium B17]|nr:c-type cytochrome biogenesis protein CcsB [bacterium B17]